MGHMNKAGRMVKGMFRGRRFSVGKAMPYLTKHSSSEAQLGCFLICV